MRFSRDLAQILLDKLYLQDYILYIMTTVIIPILSDASAYVDENNPTSNYGNQNPLIIQGVSPLQKWILLLIPIDLIPTGAVISSAYLRIYNRSLQPTLKYRAMRLITPWDALKVTWSYDLFGFQPRPIPGSPTKEFDVDVLGPTSIDITDWLTDWINDKPSYFGIAILPNLCEDSYMEIDGYGLPDAPVLEVTYSGGSLLTYWPIGSIYLSVVSTNPSLLFGGTWIAFGKGQVLVGKADSGTFVTPGASGGEETHQLSVAELAAHSHRFTWDDYANAGGSNKVYSFLNYVDIATPKMTDNAGGNTPHNNLQPYIVVYMWRRTA